MGPYEGAVRSITEVERCGAIIIPFPSPALGRRFPAPWLPRVQDGCRMGAGWPRSSPPLCLLMHLGAPSAWGTATLTAWETLSYCEMCRAALGINHSSWVWGPTSLFAHFM